MSDTAHELPTLQVLGVSCDTNHEQASVDIGRLWQRAGEAGLLSAGPEAWAVYHRYLLAGGGYRVTVTVGRAAAAGESAPDGQSLVSVPAQRGLHIATDGSLEAVREGWAAVWTRWPEGGPRAFVADLERWQMGLDGRPSRADIYVGVEHQQP